MNKTKIWLTFIFLAITILALLIPAFSARLMADDYCMSAGAKNTDFPGFFSSVYKGWSGRFAYIALTYALSRIPPNLLGLLISSAVLVWLLAIAFAIRSVCFLAGIQLNTLELGVFSCTVLAAVLKAVPNQFQNLYWRDGLVNYLVPLIFSSFSLAMAAAMVNKKKSALRAALLLLVSFLSAGFSESASIANLSFWAALGIFFLLRRHPQRKHILQILLIPILGTAAGLLLEYLAPGNSVRAGILPDRPGFLQLAALTIRNTAHLYGKLLVYGFQWVGLSLLTGMLIGFWAKSGPEAPPHGLSRRSLQTWFLAALWANFTLGAGVCAAVAYLLKAYPDDRIIIIPYFFAILTIALAGLILGRELKTRWAPVQASSKGGIMSLISFLLPMLTFFVALGAVIHFVKAAPVMTDYARRWDARDHLIRSEIAAGEKDLTIPGLESRYGLPDLQLEKDDWVNTCTADYYGAESITGK